MKILTEQEFLNNNDKCKFEHVYEDQDICLSCGISCNGDVFKKCPKNKKAWKKYKEKHTNNDALFIMMQNQ